jgi:shikimate dehydrogenase
MHNAAIAEMALNWRYLAFDVLPEDLGRALFGAMAMGFIGVNLTIPHKSLAMEMVDVLHESASNYGAVNTIRFEAVDAAGVWRPLGELDSSHRGTTQAYRPESVRSHGFNTDADAISKTLREELALEIKGARVLILGTGGAGRTAALKLAADGVAELHLVNRSEDKAQTVVEEIRERSSSTTVSFGYPTGKVDLIINATSLGLHQDDPLPVDERRFPLTQASVAFDMIYRPAETAFLVRARQAGCRATNGLAMLLHQGAKALELWSGRGVPLEVMRRALETELAARPYVS